MTRNPTRQQRRCHQQIKRLQNRANAHSSEIYDNAMATGTGLIAAAVVILTGLMINGIQLSSTSITIIVAVSILGSLSSGILSIEAAYEYYCAQKELAQMNGSQNEVRFSPE